MLTINLSPISDADFLPALSTFSYQWHRGTPSDFIPAATSRIEGATGASGTSSGFTPTPANRIAGATGSSYIPVAADLGHALRVVVSFTDLDGAMEERVSSATGTVRDTSLCDRTPQVRDAIVAGISGVNACELVTAAHLASLAQAFHLL